ncbi:MAG TPA: low affinity iron permease family protein [Candidatus Sulfopaludibacter sp.]|jgi:low affinity Fe/Cu permease|nr:low affinity iron permease family protein [Candidatus Sulfopaludibacter sp.]
MREAFRKFARTAADAVGSPAAFLIGVVLVAAWAVTGPYFHYSDTWQLVINSGTSVGTFLIVFLIQNTQNRETKVLQLKLDELIRAMKHARTELVQMEELTDAELEELQKEFQRHRDEAVGSLERIELSRQRRSQQLGPNSER